MTPSNNPQTSRDWISGWILDAYPADQGQVAVWIISETGERIRLIDSFQPNIYVSAQTEDLERLIGKIFRNPDIAKWQFADKYASPTDQQKSKVLEITLKDYRKTSGLTREILRLGDYLRYEIHNCDLHADRAYFFSKDLFPLAHVQVRNGKTHLTYQLQDSVDNIDYAVPDLDIMKLDIEIAKTAKIAKFDDPISQIKLTQNEKQITIDSGDEADKLLSLTRNVQELDPDFIVTQRRRQHRFPIPHSTSHRKQHSARPDS